MKSINTFSLVIFISFCMGRLVNASGAQCTLPNTTTSMTLDKNLELLPTQVYPCDEKGLQKVGGGFTCAQMIYCPHPHAGSNGEGGSCSPDIVQGSTFRMNSSGEVLSLYSLNVNGSPNSKGLPIVGDKAALKDALCNNPRAQSAYHRFSCLCEKKNCGSSVDLELYNSREQTGSAADCKIKKEEKYNVECFNYGPRMWTYIPFTDGQNKRMVDLVNAVAPISTKPKCTNDQQYVVTKAALVIFGHELQPAQGQYETKPVCTPLKIGDLETIYDKQYSSLAASDLAFDMNAKDTMHGRKITNNNKVDETDDNMRADIGYSNQVVVSNTQTTPYVSVGTETGFMVTQLREKLGGCFPTNAAPMSASAGAANAPTSGGFSPDSK